jgi:hypothetical protein
VSVWEENGESGMVETNKEGTVMKELELENDEAVMKGERDEKKSIFAPCDSCCVADQSSGIARI